MALVDRMIVRVGSRKSQLALLQTDIVISLLQDKYPEYDYQVVKISTTGDKILDRELSKIGDKNLFTKELEVALLKGCVDLVVHSLKDMPTSMPDGLVIGCICDRASPFDVVLMSPENRGKKLADLPPNSIVGTSALRRIAVLKRQYPKLNFVSVRGNLQTRLDKLDTPSESKTGAQKYDALILAEAGVSRLGWKARIDEFLNCERYAVGQGALACECRHGDARIQKMLSTIHCEAAALACLAERSFMNRLEGGCTTPIAVRTVLSPGGVAGSKGDDVGETRLLSLDAAVLSLDGSKCVEGSIATSLPFAMPSDCSKRRRMDHDVSEFCANGGSSKCRILDDAISEEEEMYAEDESSVFLGVHVSPMCRIGRLRMARASRLGAELAEALSALGAADILAEIKAKPLSAPVPSKPAPSTSDGIRPQEVGDKAKRPSEKEAIVVSA